VSVAVPEKQTSSADGHLRNNPTEAKGRTGSLGLNAHGNGSELVARAVLGQAETAALITLEKGGTLYKRADPWHSPSNVISLPPLPPRPLQGCHALR